jgi:hypothetical protein
MDNVLTDGMQAPFEIAQIPGRDLFVITTCLNPTSARVAQGRMMAAGIPAVLADANFAQAYPLDSPSLGGVRILVPEAHIEQALALMEAVARGDFTLDENTDVGSPELP